MNRRSESERSGVGRGRSRRGFAGMDPEERREISSMGGRASHGGRGRDYDDDDDDNGPSRSSEGQRSSGRGRQGFASMDPEEQREIASMGGRASHGGRGRDYNDNDDDEDDYSSGRSRRSSSRYDDDNEDYDDRSSSRH